MGLLFSLYLIHSICQCNSKKYSNANLRKSHLLFWWPKKAKKLAFRTLDNRQLETFLPISNVGKVHPPPWHAPFLQASARPPPVAFEIGGGWGRVFPAFSTPKSVLFDAFLAANNDDDNSMVESPGLPTETTPKKEESKPTHTCVILADTTATNPYR